MREEWVWGSVLDHDLPVQRFVLLAAMFGVSSALCLVSVVTVDHSAEAERPLLVAAVLGALVAALLWWGRSCQRWRWLLPTGLLLYSCSVAVITHQATTVVGVVVMGPAMIVACAYAGSFFRGPGLWVQMTVAAGGYVLGAALSGPSVGLVPILTTVSAAVAIGIVLSALTDRLRRLTAYDSLTGVVSRAAWLRIAADAIRDRGDRPLTIAMIDLDQFKHTNDTLGHLAGDDLLRDLTLAWRRALRGAGLLGRFGGDEFVLLLVDTDRPAAEAVLRRLRLAHPAPWTSGVASVEPAQDLVQVMDRADRELQRTKAGRAEVRCPVCLAHSAAAGEVGREGQAEVTLPTPRGRRVGPRRTVTTGGELSAPSQR